MISKSQKLPPGISFGKSARTASTTLFSVKYHEGRGRENRLAVRIPSRTVKSSVARHRIKRWILSKALTYPTRAMDMIFILKSFPLHTTKKILQDDLARATNKIFSA